MTQNTIANVLTDLNVFNSNKNWLEDSFILYEIGFYELPKLKEAQNKLFEHRELNLYVGSVRPFI